MIDQPEPDRSSRDDWQGMERSRLQDTAATLGRWQGATESQIKENTRRLDGINGSIDRVEGHMSEMKVELATIRTKVAFWAAIGSLLGAGIVSAAIALGL